ncbi:MAG: Ig-like domain-containing protein [Candidatus Eisenbacteria bacterium]
MSARGRWLALGAALLVCAAAPACSKKASVVAPVENHPPVVQSMFPAPRSTGVFYDTAIWAQFDHALDPRTVDTTTVFLKVDTRRIPVNVEYMGIVNRIQLTPRATLDLSRTYTVEMSGRIRTPEGDSLGTPVRWQFTTNSLRRIENWRPVEDRLEGPHVLLEWGGNGAITTNIMYEVYASSDSEAVLNRTMAPLQRAVYLNYLPRIAWTPGTKTYWSLTAENMTTHERLNGPVSSFLVYPADAPVDSFTLSLQDYGGAGSNNRVQFCTSQQFSTGSAFNSGIRFALSGNRPTLQVADAVVSMNANSSSAAAVATAQTQAWYAQNPWSACSFTLNGIPYTETNGYLATAEINGLHAEFRTPAVAAFVEAAGRYGNFFGLLLRGTSTVNWDVTTPGATPPSLKVWYYKPAAGVQR